MNYNGMGVSPGIAIQRTFVLPSLNDDFYNLFYEVSDTSQEWLKVTQALQLSREQLKQIKKQNKFLKTGEIAIIDAHLTILDDPLLINELKILIKDQQLPAPDAVKRVIAYFAKMFDDMEDTYLRERAQDIRDIGTRLVRNLVGESQELLPSEESFIFFAHEISPSLTAQLDPRHVKAIVTTLGSLTSHGSIMART